MNPWKDWSRWLAALAQAARSDAELAAFRSGADCRFCVVAGSNTASVFVSGDVLEIRNEKLAASFSLEAPVPVWEKFFAKVPPAFYHGVYAMKMRVPEFKVAGDEIALAQNIHLVRRLLDQLPGALKAVIGDGLSYEERGVFHPQEHRYVLDAIPSRMADKVTTKITMFTTVTGENRCRLNVEATVTAKIFMVGTLLEQKTLADLRRSYEKNAAFSNRFIRENGLT